MALTRSASRSLAVIPRLPPAAFFFFGENESGVAGLSVTDLVGDIDRNDFTFAVRSELPGSRKFLRCGAPWTIILLRWAFGRARLPVGTNGASLNHQLPFSGPPTSN